MPLIHHRVLRRELEVSEQAAEILCTAPRVPWELGPLEDEPDPTAIQPAPDEGDNALIEEE